MSARFLCVLAPGGAPAIEGPRVSVPNLPVGEWRWRRIEMGGLTALVDDDGIAGRASAFAVGGICVAGAARLDDREEVERWAGMPYSRVREASDLELIAHAVAARGTSCLSRLAGDFGFVVWHPASRTATAVRDPIGVRPFYFAAWGGAIAMSSHASLLTTSGRIDLEFVAGFLAGGFGPSERSVYADVTPVEPGTIVTFRLGRGGVTTARTRYWSALEIGQEERAGGGDAVEEVRELLFRGVRGALGDRTDVWSQLSGGIDSSSIVSVAQRLASDGGAPAGLAGTVTCVDSLGDGDEREFSDLVVRRWGLRNEIVQDFWAWQEDDGGPQADEPRLMLPFWARDRVMGSMVRDNGGRVLLSGIGPDHYLSGNPFFLADWLMAGRLADVVREAARWAVKGRVSFWRFALENVVSPLLRPGLQLRVLPARHRLPPWMAREFVRRFGLERRLPAIRARGGPARAKFAGNVAFQLESLPSFVDGGQFGDGLEVHYPYFYRPLLELSLRLPAALRAQPYARKAVLREAMRGILPEHVRTRTGKGGIDARVLWSLSRERERLDGILRDPILAQLGCIEPAALRTAVDAAREGRLAGPAPLIAALSLESWLLVRHGLWRPKRRTDPRASTLAAAPV